MKNKGITLIALVVTIVVLLILAGVSITVIFGDNGIVEQAQRAADETNEEVEKEQEDMQGIQGIIDEHTNVETGGGTVDDGNDPPILKEPQIKNIIGRVLNGYSNTTVYDEYNNPVEVPAGFAIVPNGKNYVEYKYTDTEEHIPSVQDGIVITDKIGADGTSSGNEFVWIPVGTINNKKSDEKNGPTTTIILGRYNFNDDGTPSEYEGSYTEDTSSNHNPEYKNTIAKDIEAFKSSVSGPEGKSGYYLARYEASYGGVNKPLSKPSTGVQAENKGEEYAPHTDSQIGQLWNNITQPNAATAARNMYPQNGNYESDLTNSYAWDTAIVFIQTYSGKEKYSRETSTKTTLENTGERSTGDTNTTDKVCNIYGMKNCCAEWTTESGPNRSIPNVFRGGYDLYALYPAFRQGVIPTDHNVFFSFRAILYMKK